jgi:hypothetical protein
MSVRLGFALDDDPRAGELGTCVACEEDLRTGEPKICAGEGRPSTGVGGALVNDFTCQREMPKSIAGGLKLSDSGV